MKKSLIFTLVITFILAALLPSESRAEEKITSTTLDSKIIGEKRPVHIVLPENYNKDKKYPLVIALDGSKEFLTSVAPEYHAANPELIVVGVENTIRRRDMFPSSMNTRVGKGASEKFLRFIIEELLPYIEKNYSTNGYKIITGQSNSAFFVLNAMAINPEVFDAYLAFSPMIGWDQNMIHEGTLKFLASGKASGKVLYMNHGGNGEELEYTEKFIPAYLELLKENAPADFRWVHEVVTDEGHVPDVSFRSGMKFVFAK